MVLSDNFYALHRLLEQDLRCTLVYLDPPFCTGMEFQSRRLQHAYTDKLGETAYLEFMRRRLILLRELLAEDGSIYVHIGHQMLGHMKVLMDEILGRSNFRNVIVRRKCSSKNFTTKQYANIHDYILFYTRSGKYKWHQPREKPDEAWILREYPKVDSRGRYKLVPVHAPGKRRGETGKPWRGMSPPPGKHWQYQPSKLDDMDARGEIHWSRNGNPRRKVYLEDNKTVSLTDYWAQFRDAHHQSIRITGYPTEKNLEMIKLIVAASSDPGDVVLDPFCGSGTTLEAASLGGRSWIGIDESFTALRSALKRLRHGTRAMGDYVNRKKSTAKQSTLSLFESGKPETRTARRSESERPDFTFFVDTELIGDYRKEIETLAMI
jgi:adenine-specific DNA-methyltransferase